MQMNIGEIRTERLALRPIGPQDLESTWAYAGDAENTRLMMFLPFDDLEETRRFLLECAAEWKAPRSDHYELAILLDGAHIGAVSLYFDTEPEAVELGWVLNPRYQGKGYAAEAVRAAMNYAARRWGIHRFIACCDSENAPSQRLMRRLGMTLMDDAGKRKNRGSDEARTEFRYELELTEG